MRKTAVYAALVAGIIAAFLLAGNYVLNLAARFFPPNQPASSATTNLEPYLRVAGIGLTLLVSLMTACITIVNTLVQISLNREVERLKSLLAHQYDSYKELNGAAIGLFDTLSRLQNNTYSVHDGESADQKMTQASGTLFFTPGQYRVAWLGFQTEARRAKEAANHLVEALSQGQAWNLNIIDKQGRVTTHRFEQQSQLWELFQPKVYSALEKLAERTPH
jgi:hypothetical protein